MLLNNKTKQTIREKFNVNANNKSETTIVKNINKQKNKTMIELDEIYTTENIKLDNVEENMLTNFPIDKKISAYLPNVNNLIKSYYTKNEKKYKYNIKLEDGFPSYSSGNKKITFVIYQINNFNTIPFLTYLLYKYNVKEDPDEHFTLSEIESDGINLKTKSKQIVEDVIFEKYREKPTYKGYREYKNNYYLFFEYSPTEEAIIENSKRNNNWFWVVVDELINTKKVLNFPIKRHVTDFFLNNFDITNIYSEDNTTTYETPMIAYHGSHYKKTNFVAVFGITRSSLNASLGPFYYFAPYNNAIRYAMFSPLKKPETVEGKLITIDEEGKYEKGGLVRFILFTGKTKIFDDAEEGFIKKSLISKSNDPILEWRNNYNSVFTGLYNKNIEGKHVTIYSKFVIKQYEQQVPLSYHYVNTDTDETDFEKIKIE